MKNGKYIGFLTYKSLKQLTVQKLCHCLPSLGLKLCALSRYMVCDHHHNYTGWNTQNHPLEEN
uniref:Uncharacterized protein n=1 Tax=Arundo donax TaxID=35708 RepID=A0A0A9EY87_ARUDO